jgi:hypothetical protein
MSSIPKDKLVNEFFFLLIESMKEEAICYRRLALLARDQKELLVVGNVEALSGNTRLQEKQVFALTPIIGRREETLSKIAKTFGVKKMDLNEAVKQAPAEAAENFKQALADLVQAAKELAAVNSVSGKLLDNAVAFTNFTLKAIREGGKKKSFTMAVAAEDNKPSFVNRIV